MLSICNTGAPAPCPAPFNLAQYVLKAGLETPDKIALAVLKLSGAERWSYARLRKAVLGTATGLLQSGLTPGDIALMRLGNSVEFPIAYLGAIAAGLVPVPTSAQLTEAEVAGILAHLRPRVVLRDPEVACPETGPTTDRETAIPQIDTATLRSWRDLPPAAFHMGDPDRLAYIVYTSGTSGTPRAVGHAHRAIWARRMMMQDWYAMTPQDRILHAGAFNWTFTLGTGLMDPWTLGATALIPAAGVSHAQLPLLMKRHEASLFAAAPGVYRNILKSQLPALPKLRHGLAAGEKLSESLREGWLAATGTQVYEAFGMSECSTFVSASPTRPAAPKALGQPQRGRQVAILGPDGPVPCGSPGVIAVHRDDPGLMLGYIGAPEATRAKFQGDWFLTGDQGVMDAEGQITYLGRSDDMMNAGGYRVSPIEVEQAFADLPGLTEIGVTQVEVKPDVFIIAAFYTAQDPIDTAVLHAHAHERLAHYKTPRSYVHLERLPRNANGKLMRSALAELLPTGSV